MSTGAQGEGSRTESGDFITVARVVKAQGRIGEVAVVLFTDFPERFAERRRLHAWFPDGSRRELELENFWPHKGRMILKFAGVEDIDAAQRLIGAEIQIPQAERTALEEGAFYISDLKGCRVFVAQPVGDEWRELGAVSNVIFGAGEAPLLEVREGPKEYLIPFVEGYTRKVDPQAKRIELVLPEGMLELDAPVGKKRSSESGD